MLTSPVTGWLGDRFPRKPMIVLAALFWGGINLLTATVHSYDSLNLRHAALGVGEASFGIFAPSMLAADFYPPAINVTVSLPSSTSPFRSGQPSATSSAAL